METFRSVSVEEVAVAAPRMLAPTSGDVWYAKVFLDETVDWLNDPLGISQPEPQSPGEGFCEEPSLDLSARRRRRARGRRADR
jgi:hypothetical protein